MGSGLSHADQGLIAEIESVLVDPNVHTDLRLRLDWQIRELLGAPPPGSAAGAGAPARQPVSRTPAPQPGRAAPRATSPEPEASASPETEASAAPEPDPGTRRLLTAVLEDPNLHTDARLHLHAEITELLQQARLASGHAQAKGALGR